MSFVSHYYYIHDLCDGQCVNLNYSDFWHWQGDVFLAPQIHAAINRFQIDMVLSFSLIFFKVLGFLLIARYIFRMNNNKLSFLADKVPNFGTIP